MWCKQWANSTEKINVIPVSAVRPSPVNGNGGGYYSISGYEMYLNEIIYSTCFHYIEENKIIYIDSVANIYKTLKGHFAENTDIN